MLTEQQLQQRLSFLTGSDTGTICGVNPYQTVVELWQYKTRRAVAKDIGDRPAVKAGNMLESAVANWFEMETGKKVLEDNNFHVHKDIPFLGGNIDRFVAGENALLECKTTQVDKGWGQGFTHGDNKIPDSYLCQVIHYLAVTNRDVAYIAVLIRGIDFRWYKYERDLELEKKIIAREVSFWENHVLADRAPSPTSADEVILLLNGRTSQDIAMANTEVSIIIDQLRENRENLKQLELIEGELKDKLCVYMNDKCSLLNLDGTLAATWKTTSPIERFDTKSFERENIELYNKYLKVSPGQRRFLLK